MIKRKAREGYDYKLVPKSVWESLQKRFGGRSVIRQKEQDNYPRKYVVKYEKVREYCINIYIDSNIDFGTL